MPSTTQPTTDAEPTTEVEEETTEQSPTKMASHKQKLNLERFFRLSRRPIDSKSSPFLRHRMSHNSKAANTQMLSVNAPSNNPRPKVFS